MRLSRLVAVLAAVALVATARPVRAQADLTFRDAPLAEALYALSERTGIEIVFATRLVGEERVSGRYGTDDPDRALRLMLRGTGVRAERIRAGQYVLIAVPPTVAAGLGDDPKAYTGALEGHVVDAETGQALGGAHVWLVDVGLGDVVDPGGTFLVPDLPAGRYTVRVSHVGYRAVRVDLDVFPDSPRLPPTVRLTPEPIAAADVQVVAGTTDTGPAPGVTELDPRDAATLPVAFGEGDLAASLSWLPGLSRTGGSSGPLVVRGADPYQTRTVRDGVPVYEPWHAFGLVSVFQPEALARVRFHRGTLPAPLGGAIGGVLDVETTDALAGDTAVTVALSPVAARVTADVALSPGAGLHVGLRRSTLGALLRPRLVAEAAGEGRADGVLVLDPIGRRGGSRADVVFGDAEARLSLRLGSRVRLDGGALAARDAVTAGPEAGSGPLDYRWASLAMSARLRALLGERTFVTAVAYRSGHDAREVRTVSLARDVRQTLAETGVWVDLDHFLSSRHQLQGGLAVAHRRIAGTDSAATVRDPGGEVAVYAMDTWTPAQAWQVQPGLRVEAVADGGRVSHVLVSPRLSARWTPVEDVLTVRAGVGRQTQTLHRTRTSAGDRYTLAAMRWLAAGKAVAPGTAWHTGLGAEWVVTPRVALRADGYGRWAAGLREGPAGDVPGAEPGLDADALAARYPPHDGRAWGVELAARVDAGAWTLGVTGTAARALVRPADRPGARWQAAAYDRPLAAGALAERRSARLSLALRLDAESGRVRADGRRAPVEVRAAVAAGIRHRLGGVDWHLLAQATARPLGDGAPVAVAGADGWPLATDPTGLPALPLVSLTGRW